MITSITIYTKEEVAIYNYYIDLTENQIQLIIPDVSSVQSQDPSSGRSEVDATYPYVLLPWILPWNIFQK